MRWLIVAGCLVLTALPLCGEDGAVLYAQLRGAEQLRAQTAQAEAAWLAESGRLQALIALQEARLAALKQEQGELDQRLAAQAKALEAETQASAQRSALSAQVLEACAQRLVAVQAALARVPRQFWPSLPTLPSDPLAALHSVKEVEQATQELLTSWRVGLAVLPVHGVEQAVHLLLAGDQGLWWAASVGAAAGPGRIQEDGQVLLLPAANVTEERAIRRAVAAVAGSTLPEAVLLPWPEAH